MSVISAVVLVLFNDDLYISNIIFKSLIVDDATSTSKGDHENDDITEDINDGEEAEEADSLINRILDNTEEFVRSHSQSEVKKVIKHNQMLLIHPDWVI